MEKTYKVIQFSLWSDSEETLDKLACTIYNGKDNPHPFEAKDILEKLGIESADAEETWWFRPGRILEGDGFWFTRFMEISEKGMDSTAFMPVAENFLLSVGRNLIEETTNPIEYIQKNN